MPDRARATSSRRSAPRLGTTSPLAPAVPALALAAVLTAAAATEVDGQEPTRPGPAPPPTPSITVAELPTRYAAGRFRVAPVTGAGDTLVLYTDTGGGASMLFPDAVERLGLETRRLEFRGDSARLARFPAWRPGAAVPDPALLPPAGPWLLVRKPHPGMNGDGFLGRTWFAGRVWLFDYPDGSLGRVLGYDASSVPDEHRVRLGFQADSTGRRTTHFPRVRIAVDGDSLDMLLDTGATVTLSRSARRELGADEPADRATSFIVRSVYERWRERHPGWRVLEGADRRFEEPMIRVPRVSVAGHSVGPVWFTVRPDRNFREKMSKWMDRPVDGALGGSALRHFRVLVDYPSASAVFMRPGGR